MNLVVYLWVIVDEREFFPSRMRNLKIEIDEGYGSTSGKRDNTERKV
jgi:hypothetical protein